MRNQLDTSFTADPASTALRAVFSRPNACNIVFSSASRQTKNDDGASNVSIIAPLIASSSGNRSERTFPDKTDIPTTHGRLISMVIRAASAHADDAFCLVSVDHSLPRFVPFCTTGVLYKDDKTGISA